MSFLQYIPIIGDIIKKTGDVVDQAVPDKDLAAKLKQEIDKEIMKCDLTSLQEQSSVIKSEATGESWLQRNWRPLVMIMFAYIVFNNFILAPYIQCFYRQFPILPVPENLWDLLKLGIGGYIVGRSGEKITREIMKAKK